MTKPRPKGRPGRPAMSEVHARRVRRALARVVKDYHGNQTAAARALKVSAPAVSQALRGVSGPGYVMAREVARVLGCSLDDVLAGAAV